MGNDGSFYYIHFADKAGLAVAQAEIDMDLERRLWAGGHVTWWEPLALHLDTGTVVDYLANSYTFRLCSQRLREVIDHNRGDRDVLQWLPLTVVDRAGAELPYWVLHFPEIPDVIHKTRSVFSGSVLVKACIDTSLAAAHRVFTLSRYGVYLVVTDQVKSAITRAGCTGMEFSRLPAA